MVDIFEKTTPESNSWILTLSTLFAILNPFPPLDAGERFFPKILKRRKDINDPVRKST
jgi:hypothetical protein